MAGKSKLSIILAIEAEANKEYQNSKAWKITKQHFYLKIQNSVQEINLGPDKQKEHTQNHRYMSAYDVFRQSQYFDQMENKVCA